MSDEASVFDRAVDILLERQEAVRKELSTRFKRTKPFRAEPVSPADRINNYMKLKADPELEMQMRQQMGQDFQNYENDILDIIRRNSDDD